MSKTTCAEVLSVGTAPRIDTEAVDPAGITKKARRSPTRFLLIGERVEGFFVERFSDSGELLAETQHETLDEAMQCVYSEYEAISDWMLCPDDADPLEYIRARSPRSVDPTPGIGAG